MHAPLRALLCALPLLAYAASSPVLPAYQVGTQKATRRAYGEALAALGSVRPDVLNGMLATIHDQLDAARRLRLARDA